MKKIRISIDDLLTVLEAMRESGTREIVMFEYNGSPAISDVETPDNIISFQIEGGDEYDGDEVMH